MALLASDVAGDVARKLLCDVPLMMQPAAKTDKLAKLQTVQALEKLHLRGAAAAARPELLTSKCLHCQVCDNPSV